MDATCATVVKRKQVISIKSNFCNGLDFLF